ncbi:ABC transporter permease subunit [Anaerolineales bacterium]
MTIADPSTQVASLKLKPDSPLKIAFRSLMHNTSAIVGMTILGILLIMFIFAPLLATHDPLLSMIGIDGEVPPIPRKAPCLPIAGCEEPMHIMGLDLNGRDVFSRVIWGARTSLPVGLIAVSISVIFGTFLGLVAGYAGGWVDNVIMRIMDVMLAFPSLLLAIAIVTILGPDLINALIAISIVAIPSYARLTRASVLSVKEMEFVTAERALGARPGRILFFQILPNILTPLIVQATLGVGTAVLDAAALSFLGLGAQPPLPEWGQMLSEARQYVFTAPHMVFFPGFAIMFTVLGFNLLGDGMRDALDPRLNKE